jgi:subtilase family serine protease
VGLRTPVRYLTVFFGVAAMASLAAVPLAGISAGTVTAAHTAQLSRMVPADVFHGKPLIVPTSKPDKHGQLFSCQASQSASNPVPCYGPSQIAKAYDIPSKLTGAGETIVIIDAFGDPTLQSDLDLFDATFGLPGATVNVICPDPRGCPTFDPSNADEVNWASEISLDVQWSHADAPGATIDLVVAYSDQDADIQTAQHYVVTNNLGDVLSQSFGEGETCMDPTIQAEQHQDFVTAEGKDMTVFASAGDQGASQPDCNGDGGFFLSAATPASDPLVTGVGGTHLNANFNNGAYHSETVWNNSGENPDFGAGGGGFSTLYSRPSYQNGFDSNSARGVPDVTYNADIYGGVLAVCSECGAGQGAFFIFGGTSSGSPQWAAFTALADQAAGHRVGLLNPALYAIAAGHRYGFAFNDITTGNNSWDVSGVTGYSAGLGWDPASGLGSPDVAHLISLIT